MQAALGKPAASASAAVGSGAASEGFILADLSNADVHASVFSIFRQELGIQYSITQGSCSVPRGNEVAKPSTCLSSTGPIERLVVYSQRFKCKFSRRRRLPPTATAAFQGCLTQKGVRCVSLYY